MGVPMRADLSAISQAILRCETSSLRGGGAENGVLRSPRRSLNSKI